MSKGSETDEASSLFSASRPSTPGSFDDYASEHQARDTTKESQKGRKSGYTMKSPDMEDFQLHFPRQSLLPGCFMDEESPAEENDTVLDPIHTYHSKSDLPHNATPQKIDLSALPAESSLSALENMFVTALSEYENGHN
ncbi:hypothetical protein KEM55_000448 [Ascosphaera atra]|nr:hypothetical protein KEM55_000448 [Ascosphaera atra]